MYKHITNGSIRIGTLDLEHQLERLIYSALTHSATTARSMTIYFKAYNVEHFYIFCGPRSSGSQPGFWGTLGFLLNHFVLFLTKGLQKDRF